MLFAEVVTPAAGGVLENPSKNPKNHRFFRWRKLWLRKVSATATASRRRQVAGWIRMGWDVGWIGEGGCFLWVFPGWCNKKNPPFVEAYISQGTQGRNPQPPSFDRPWVTAERNVCLFAMFVGGSKDWSPSSLAFLLHIQQFFFRQKKFSTCTQLFTMLKI